MSNMSYCQFENTAAALRQIRNTLEKALENGLSFDQFMERLSSDYERRGVKEVSDLLLDIADALEQLHDNPGLSEEELDELEDK